MSNFRINEKAKRIDEKRNNEATKKKKQVVGLVNIKNNQKERTFIMASIYKLGLLFILISITSAEISEPSTNTTPNPVYDVSKYTTSLGSTNNGLLYSIAVPGSLIPFQLMHLYGNATERGFAHGELLASTIINFVEKELPDFYKQEIAGLNLGGLPIWLQKLIKSLGKAGSKQIAKIALGYILKTQRKYLEASKANVFSEMEAIAHGVCNKLPQSDTCKNDGVSSLIETIEQVNMLPELIRMQCSMMGAWGESTVNGKLLQLRTLDFGGGPFSNHTMLIINHPSDGREETQSQSGEKEYETLGGNGNAFATVDGPFSGTGNDVEGTEKGNGNAFATVGFPAFVGAVTGFSENIGLCEKVDDVTKPTPVPKGSYDGQADSFVIRDVIEFAKTKEDGINILKNAHRTWPIWIGLGDYTSQEFNAMEYTQKVVNVFTDKTLPNATNQTYFESVAYIDKHPQPSPHIDMPGLVKEYYGKMTGKNIVQNFPRLMESGDVHIALYDFGEKQVYIAVGTTNSTGGFVRKAYEAPFLQFDMETLWGRTKPN